jgi:hypothetical protein
VPTESGASPDTPSPLDPPQGYCSRSTRTASPCCHSNVRHHGPFTCTL